MSRPLDLARLPHALIEHERNRLLHCDEPEIRMLGVQQIVDSMGTIAEGTLATAEALDTNQCVPKSRRRAGAGSSRQPGGRASCAKTAIWRSSGIPAVLKRMLSTAQWAECAPRVQELPGRATGTCIQSGVLCGSSASPPAVRHRPRKRLARIAASRCARRALRKHPVFDTVKQLVDELGGFWRIFGEHRQR
jgi:hypothetical protein